MAIPVLGAIQGLAGIAGGIIGSGARRREQQAAQAEFDKNKDRMQSADTSNLMANQENVFEDLTVNTQEADFINQQQKAGLATTMNSLQGAAGGSGLAALAQVMAGQDSQNAQAAAASIGKQEAGNQAAERQMQAQLNQQDIQGQYQSRAAEKDKNDTLLGMSQQRLGAANKARASATKSIIGGVAGAAAGGLGMFDKDGFNPFIGTGVGEYIKALKK